MTEDEVEDLLGWAPQIAKNSLLQGSGEIPIVGFSEEIKAKVENQLSNAAKDLESKFREIIKCFPILEASVQAFGGDFSWVKNEF